MARLQLNPVTVGFTAGGTFTNLTSNPPGANFTSLTGATGVAFINNGNMALLIWNGAAAATTATLNIGRQEFGLVPVPPTATIPSSVCAAFGTFQPSLWTSQDGTGNTYIDINPVTTVSVCLVALVSQAGT